MDLPTKYKYLFIPFLMGLLLCLLLKLSVFTITVFNLFSYNLPLYIHRSNEHF